MNSIQIDRKTSEDVRQSTLEKTQDDIANTFHIVSNLNWRRYERQVEFVLKTVPEGGRVLDIGCGWGHTTALIAASRRDLKVTGTDIDDVVSWQSLRKYGAKYEVTGKVSLPFADGEFDCCVAFGVMEHTDNDESFLNQIRRVLKTGGALIIFNLPNRYALFEHFANLVGIKSHDRTYDSSRIRNLMASTRFNIVSIKREFFLPAQVDRVGKKLGILFNRHYMAIDKADIWLTKPFGWFAQSYFVFARKGAIK